MTPWTVVCQAPRLWDFPGKNIGVVCHFLLQGNIPDPGLEPASPALAGGFFTIPHLCIHLCTEKMILIETDFPHGWMCYGH